MRFKKRDGNVPHNRGCGELMLGVIGLMVVAVIALCAL